MTPCRIVFVLICAVFAGSAVAQDGFLTADQQAKWTAVGRIATAGPDGSATCTGALIAPDLVITAGHCAVPFRDADAQALTQFVFLAGLRDGVAVARSHAAAVMFAPDFQPGKLTPATVAKDVSLVRLANPITTVTPIPAGGLMAFDNQVGFIGYVNALPFSPTMQTDCSVEQPHIGVIALDCAVVSGNSGAPLLAGLPDAPRVVGVISAKAPKGAFAASLPAWVFDVLDER